MRAAHRSSVSRFRTLLCSVAALLLVACSSDGLAEPEPLGDAQSAEVVAEVGAAADTSGVYVADSGFRPGVDGFSFENYSNGPEVVNLRPAEMHALFGDAICADGTGPTCRLSSPAVTWMDQLNAMMDGGHCEGFAVLSQLFLAGAATPTEYGAEVTFELDPEADTEVRPTIARWFATQASEPSSSGRRMDMTPVEVVDELTATLGQPRTPENTYTIAIFQPGYEGGHAVTPYAIEDRGDGIVWIMIYDNNYPGVPRAIEVDLEENTWSYQAGTNPAEESELYLGDASTFTLAISPLSARLAAQECPFCDGELDEDLADRNQLSLTGPGARLAGTDFYVTDTTGRAFGRRGGDFVTEIEDGAWMPVLTGLDDAPAPMLDVPASFDSTVTIAAGDQDATDMDFALVGAGYDVFITGIDIAMGAADTVALTQDGSRVSYTSHTTRTPTIEVTTGNEAGWTYDVKVRAVSLDRPARMSLISPEDSAELYIGARAGGTYEVELLRIAPDGSTTTVGADRVRVGESQLLMLPLDGWTGDAPFEATIVGDDGSVVKPVRFR